MTTQTEAARSLDALLRRSVRGEVSDGVRRRAEYATDASNYRVVPQVVVEPVDVDDIIDVLEVSRQTAVPVTSRGGGTSVAGNAMGPGIVLDVPVTSPGYSRSTPTRAPPWSNPASCWPACNARPRRSASGSARTRRPTRGRPSAG